MATEMTTKSPMISAHGNKSNSDTADGWDAPAVGRVVKMGRGSMVNIGFPDIYLRTKFVITDIGDNGSVYLDIEQYLLLDSRSFQEFTEYYEKRVTLEKWYRIEKPTDTSSKFFEEDQSNFDKLSSTIPQTTFANMNKIETTNTIRFHVPTKKIIVQRKIRGVLTQAFTLENYPFDRQCLYISFNVGKFNIHSWQKDEAGHFVACPWRAGVDDKTVAAITGDEWSVVGMVVAKSAVQGAMIDHVITLERNAYPCVINCSVVVYVSVMVACFVVACDVSDFGTRGSITVTLLLTLVAFKSGLVSNGIIPKVPFLTIPEKYVLAGLLMILAEMIENLVVSYFSTLSNNAAVQGDIAFNVLFGLIWNVLHIAAFLGYRYGWWRSLPTNSMTKPITSYASDEQAEQPLD